MGWDLCVTLTIGIKRKQKRLNFLHLNFFLHLTCHVNRTSTLLLLILQQKLTSRGVTVFINYLLTEKNIPTKKYKFLVIFFRKYFFRPKSAMTI